MITELSAAQIKRFDDWESAKEFLTSLEGRFVFRGLGNAEWDLVTSLDRCAHYRHAEAERVLTECFERSLPKVTGHSPPSADRPSWLALMRHYGLPSRLLDCTNAFPVAAYFATVGHPKSDFAIWAFEINAVLRSAEQSLGILNAANAPLSPLELGTDPTFTAVFDNTKCFVALVDANQKTERQRKQEGLFLCPGSSEQPFWRNLMDMSSLRANGALYQIILPCDAYEQVQADLSSKNIDHEELLPDPDQLEELGTEIGDLLSQSQGDRGHLQWKLEILPRIQSRGLKAEVMNE